MPHLTLEYSNNVETTVDQSVLFSQLHRILSDVAGIPEDNCKSRSYQADSFRVGSGAPENGFVHLDIRLLDGRTMDIKRQIGRESLRALKAWFRSDETDGNIQITVDVDDIVRETYAKHPPGTLSHP